MTSRARLQTVFESQTLLAPDIVLNRAGFHRTAAPKTTGPTARAGYFQSAAITDQQDEVRPGTRGKFEYCYSRVPDHEFITDYQQLQGLSLTVSQVRGLLVKKLLYMCRGYHLTCLQLLLSLVLLWIGLSLVEKSSPEPAQRLTLDSTHVKDTKIFTQPDPGDESLASHLANEYLKGMPIAKDKNHFGHSHQQVTKWMPFNSVNPVVTRDENDKAAILIGAKFATENSLNDSVNISMTAMYNLQAYHSEPLAIAMMMDAVYRYYMQDQNYSDSKHGTNQTKEKGKEPSQGVRWSVLPLPLTCADARVQLEQISHRHCLWSSVAILSSVTFLTSMSAVFLIRERVVGFKHLQNLSGVGSFLYLVTSSSLDWLVCAVGVILNISTLYISEKLSQIYGDHGEDIILLLLSYIMASLPLVFTIQYFFKSVIPCLIVLFCARVIIGSLFLVLRTNYSTPTEMLLCLATNLTCLTVLKPSVTLSVLLYSMCSHAQNQMITLHLANRGQSHPGMPCCAEDNPVGHDEKSKCSTMISEPLVVNAGDWMDIFTLFFIQFLFWTFTWLAFDSGSMQALCKNLQLAWEWLMLRTKNWWHAKHLKKQKFEEESVLYERVRVNEASFREYVILRNLTKTCGRKKAVKNVNVAIGRGEIFGFLGKARNGKSKILEIVSGQTTASAGELLINMNKSFNMTAKVRAGMTYCPQVDPLMSELTGWETLTLFARLRGIPGNVQKKVVKDVMKALSLSQVAKRIIASYSPSERRKLSLAIAVLGQPQIIVVDEPSQGMNPEDARRVWHVLSHLGKRRRTVILASSNAEECETVCTRVSIVIKGKLALLTTPADMVIEYGTGYTAIVTFQCDAHGVSLNHIPFITLVIEEFRDAEIVSDDDHAIITFLDGQSRLAKILGLMEDGKKYFDVLEYSLEQTSLKHLLLTTILGLDVEEIVLPGVPFRIQARSSTTML